MSDVTVERTTVQRLHAAAREPMPTLEPDAGAVLHAANVETPRRDSRRRRALAAADVLALLGACGVLWLVATPPLVLVLALPLWVVLNKSLRLYDRDANLVHQSTLNELPKIFHSLSLGAALALLLGVALDRGEVLLWWLAAMAFTPTFRYAARELVRRSATPERVLLIGSGQVAALVARKLAKPPRVRRRARRLRRRRVRPAARRRDRRASLPGLDRRTSSAFAASADVERVIVAFSSAQHERLLDVDPDRQAAAA